MEIEQANSVYGRLDTISAIRAQLADMAAEQPYQEVWDSPVQARPQYHTVQPQTFYNNAPALWGRIEETVDQLLTQGNPISEHGDGASSQPPHS